MYCSNSVVRLRLCFWNVKREDRNSLLLTLLKGCKTDQGTKLAIYKRYVSDVWTILRTCLLKFVRWDFQMITLITFFHWPVWIQRCLWFVGATVIHVPCIFWVRGPWPHAHLQGPQFENHCFRPFSLLCSNSFLKTSRYECLCSLSVISCALRVIISCWLSLLFWYPSCQLSPGKEPSVVSWAWRVRNDEESCESTLFFVCICFLS